MAFKDLKDLYSTDTQATYNTLGKTEAQRPPAYQSKYEGTMDSLINQIVDRGPFNYDLANDKLYQQYKEAYASLGRNAMVDSVAEVGNLTGGYGNSYAASAGAQGYQEYLRNMNDIIPELYQAAMNKHAMDTQALRDKLNAVGDAENRAYSQYRDTVADWNADRDYYLGKLDKQQSADEWRAGYNQDESQFNQNLAWDREKFDRNMQYQRDYDAWRERKEAEERAKAEAAKAAKASAQKSGGSGRRRGRKGSGGSEETVAPFSGTTHNTMSTTDRNYDLVTDSIREEKFGSRQMQRDQAAIDAAVRKAWEEDLKADELREEQRRRRR